MARLKICCAKRAVRFRKTTSGSQRQQNSMGSRSYLVMATSTKWTDSLLSVGRIDKSMHLINIPNQERETEAIIRLLDTDPLIEPLFRDLGLTWPLCWCVVQLDHKKLVSTRFGDVDILQ